jgi:Cd2+/Zn2+-exporting ATPase
MKKTRINLNIILPEVADERDECVGRIVGTLQNKRGIEKVHIVPKNGHEKAQFCFHYNPQIISISKIEQLARKAGADITETYGHLLVEIGGVQHPRHARLIEAKLKSKKGIQNVSVAGTGYLQLEYNKIATSETKIVEQIKRAGLTIKKLEELHAHDPAEEAHQEEGHSHEHIHSGILGERKELYFAIICGIFLAIGFVLSFVDGLSEYVSLVSYILAYLLGGFYTTKEAIAGISKGQFEIDFLMLVAAAGAALLGQWAEGALLLFLFSLGHSLEHYAMQKAKKSIAALTDLAPKTALLKTDDELKEVKIEELEQGDVIVVKPNSKISADGVVLNGFSNVNQAPITGESIPVDKMPVEDAGIDISNVDKLDAKHKVFAGCINGSENLEIKVTRVAADSTIARLVKLVNEAQTQKSPTQNLTDKIEKYYVPSVLILVFLLLFAFVVVDEPFSASFYRAMSVLVAASPCALAISTPSAVLSGVARAARGGVLVKGGKPLEEMGSLTAIAFDKTGTLTEGKPKLTGIYPLNDTTEEQLLKIVIAVEQLSDHPLAAAIESRIQWIDHSYWQ